MDSSRLRARQPVTDPDTSTASIILGDSLPAASIASTNATPHSTPLVSTSSTASPPLTPATPLPGNLPVLKKAPYNYVVGEKCMAKWTDSRRWRATVQTVLDLGEWNRMN